MNLRVRWLVREVRVEPPSHASNVDRDVISMSNHTDNDDIGQCPHEAPSPERSCRVEEALCQARRAARGSDSFCPVSNIGRYCACINNQPNKIIWLVQISTDMCYT
jgi:hypothetical protein